MSALERLIPFLESRGRPKEYTAEELQEQSLLLDWIATNLVFERPKQGAPGLWSSQYPKETDHEALAQRGLAHLLGGKKEEELVLRHLFL